MPIPINKQLPASNSSLLSDLATKMREQSLEVLGDKEDRDYLSLNTNRVHINLQRNFIDQTIWRELLQLAEEKQLTEAIGELFSGAKVNFSEQRPALHSALRMPQNSGVKRTAQVQQSLARMRQITDQLHNQRLFGSTGKPITDVVHLGIGGSLLGPKLLYDALVEYHSHRVSVHFIANYDGYAFKSRLEKLNPETTLFIVASKSFTTQETLCNARTALQWLKPLSEQAKLLTHHFIAITANTQLAIDFGILEDRILPIWDWVGGRYSVWSAISLPVMIGTNADCFEKFLAGGHEMDQHFQNTPLERNIPVMMAIMGIWYTNFFASQTHAIITYNSPLDCFSAFLQQLEMESNGKSVNKRGQAIDYATAPVVWGQNGTQGQHAYYQMLHQGRHLTPIDFIFANNPHTLKSDDRRHHDLIIANLLAHSHVLASGKTHHQTRGQAVQKNIANKSLEMLAKHQSLLGDRPSTVILLNDLSPQSVGQLIAMYEHKVYVQSVIWEINAFDQWGVQEGKDLAKAWHDILTQPSEIKDPITQKLLNIIQRSSA